ncbi:hypothetical protein GQS_08815 [Thermococcus sp. 4557]|uniref:potassium channel family protein n=1 Tax=Thermococcus sp. (strain CGMCC 1.5172 / 4557) TaxID=1042877 RepID=UPI000219EEF9|nr:potassium channel family protein [Thermococcus sp. 4557]AEK73657.1 hypothetical protein GQS_08815 [Thermococcus sp. 4557]
MCRMAHFGNCDPETADQEYCIFHKPDKNENEAREFYNKFVLKFFGYKSPRSEGLVFAGPVDARGFVFPSATSRVKYREWGETTPFRYTLFKKSVDFSEACFSSDTLFFGPPALFDSVTFESHVYFNDSNFREARFCKVKFFKGVNFEGIESHGRMIFEECQFVSGQKINDVLDVRFKGANFYGPVIFDHCVFTTDINFESVHFHSDAIFGDEEMLFRSREEYPGGFPFKTHASEFHAEMDFHNSEFKGNVNFESCIFDKKVNFQYCLFSEERGETNFSRSRFKDTSLFDSAQFRNVSFNSVVFEKDVSFNNATFHGDTTFEGSVFERVASFVNTGFYDELSFANCDFKEGADFLGKLKNETDTSQLWNFFKSRFSNIQALIEVARVQRLSFEKEGKRDEADRMFVLEMRAKRKLRLLNSKEHLAESRGLSKLKAYFGYLGTWLGVQTEKVLADWITQYGTSWRRILISSGAVIGIIGFVYWILSMFSEKVFLGIPVGTIYTCEHCATGGILGFLNALYYSLVTFTTLGYGDMHPTGWLKALSAIEALTGAVFMALIVAVIARKWMR